MRKIVILSVCMLIVCSMIFAGGNQETEKNEKAKIAVMFGVGGLGDQSFNDNVNNGIKTAKSKLDFEYDYVEPKATSEFENFLREFAQSKEYVLIIIAGSDAADAVKKIATAYPDQDFMLLDATVDAPNVLGIIFKDNESTFLGGYAAALASTTGKIGAIGALDIDVINGFIAGWEAGAKQADPDIILYRSYCGGFADPVTAKEMALQMYNSGADIVFGAAGGSGLGIFQAAQETDNYAVGVDSNQNPVKPDYIMMSCIRKFDAILTTAISEELLGIFKGGLKQVGINDDAVDCTFEGSNVDVPQKIKDSVAALKVDVKAGKVKIPSSL